MISLLALATKELVDELSNKDKRDLKRVLKEIEDELIKDKALSSIMNLTNVNDLEELVEKINNPLIKEELEGLKNVRLKEIKIFLLKKIEELNKTFENIDLSKNSILYLSTNLFKEGQKISGKVLKAIMSMDEQEEIEVKGKEIREKTKDKESEIAKKESDRTFEELEEKKKKDGPMFGMPKRANISIGGPGL